MQHGVRALVAEVAAARTEVIAAGTGKLRGPTVRQVFGGSPAYGGLALAAQQGVAAEVVEGTADIGVGDLQAHRAFAQVHGEVVVHQPGLHPGIVLKVEGGLVGHPGAARLRPAVVARQVRRVGGTRVMLDLFFGQAPGQVVFGLPVAQVETRFQVRVEAVADIRGDTLGAATAVRLIAVVFRIGQSHVVIEVAQHLARADVPMLVAAAADLVPHLQWCGIVAGMGHVVDGAPQGQGALIEAIGPAQYLGTAQPQRLEQLIRRPPWAGQR
ncbi:hypothetical protein D3C81_835380 [compost metagenome]